MPFFLPVPRPHWPVTYGSVSRETAFFSPFVTRSTAQLLFNRQTQDSPNRISHLPKFWISPRDAYFSLNSFFEWRSTLVLLPEFTSFFPHPFSFISNFLVNCYSFPVFLVGFRSPLKITALLKVGFFSPRPDQ